MSNFIVIDYVMFCFACFIDVHIGKFVSRIEKWLTSALLAFLYLPNYLPTYLPTYLGTILYATGVVQNFVFVYF